MLCFFDRVPAANTRQKDTKETSFSPRPSPAPLASLSLSLTRPKHEKLHNAAHTREGFFRKKTKSRHPHYRASSWLVNSSVACSKLTVQALLLSLLLRLLSSLARSACSGTPAGGEGRGGAQLWRTRTGNSAHLGNVFHGPCPDDSLRGGICPTGSVSGT